MHAKAGAEYSRYVQLFPVMAPEDVARIGYRGFKRGKKVIVAGWFNRLSVFARRFAPDFAARSVHGFAVQGARRRRQSANAGRVPKPADSRVPDKPASGDGPSLAA